MDAFARFHKPGNVHLEIEVFVVGRQFMISLEPPRCAGLHVAPHPRPDPTENPQNVQCSECMYSISDLKPPESHLETKEKTATPIL